MINSADIFLILRGGIGTLDEFFEVWTTKQLGEHNKTIIMMNYENYFDNLLGFIRKMISEDFLLLKHFEDIIVCETIDEIFTELGKFWNAYFISSFIPIWRKYGIINVFFNHL